MNTINTNMKFNVVGFEQGVPTEFSFSLSNLIYEEDDLEILHTIRENIDDYLGMTVDMQKFIYLTRDNPSNSLGVIKRTM
jgi:uncharacterized membrane protein YcgQ (UPF0703/DUF1980 family)